VHYENRQFTDKWVARRIKRHHFSGFSPQCQCKSVGTVSCEHSFPSGIGIVVLLILSFDLGMIYPRVSHCLPVETNKWFILISSMTDKSCQLEQSSQKP